MALVRMLASPANPCSRADRASSRLAAALLVGLGAGRHHRAWASKRAGEGGGCPAALARGAGRIGDQLPEVTGGVRSVLRASCGPRLGDPAPLAGVQDRVAEFV